MRVDQSLSSEGGGEEREGKEVTSGSQWKLEDCIQIPCGIPRLSKTDLEIHRFLGIWIQFCALLFFLFDVATVLPSNLLHAEQQQYLLSRALKTGNTHAFQMFLGMEISL